MKFVHLFGASILAGATLGCAVHAQPLPSAQTERSEAPQTRLAIAVEAAWQRAVLFTESTGLARQAAAEKTAAQALWAAPPSLEISHRTDRLNSNTGVRETELGIAVPMWLPGQRAARQSAASAESVVAEQMRLRARLDVAGSVREQLWEVAQLQAETTTAKNQVETLAQLHADVDRRVKAGDLARADALAAEGEWLTAQATLNAVQMRLKAAQGQWLALTGLPASALSVSMDAEDVRMMPPEGHPSLRLAAVQVDTARRKLELASTVRRGAPEVIARSRQDVGGHGASAVNSIGLAIRIPFATADRNEPLIAAALSELELAQAREAQLRIQVDTAIQTAVAALAVAESSLKVERARAQLLRERSTLIDASFRAGETSLPELLRASVAAAQAEASSSSQQALLGLARARLQQAYGKLP